MAKDISLSVHSFPDGLDGVKLQSAVHFDTQSETETRFEMGTADQTASRINTISRVPVSPSSSRPASERTTSGVRRPTSGTRSVVSSASAKQDPTIVLSYLKKNKYDDTGKLKYTM